jgi:uncharacterized protein (TIGR02611 family)
MVKSSKMKATIKKTSVGILGGLVVILGLILIPYPGPGWLIVFAGLEILATEFDRAQRVLDFARGKYNDWQEWVKRQPKAVQLIFWVLTCIVVMVTIWLLNGYGLINDLLHLDQDWVRSPLPFFY